MNITALRNRFDYCAYWRLLEHLTSSHRALPFAALVDGFPNEPFFILRHDVDYSTAAALALAERECERGIRATYFLLPNSLYYNLLDPEHACVPQQLTAMGHEVGLHYDVNLLYRFPRTRWLEILGLQVSLLETLSGVTVRAIAMHQPGLNGVDPLAGITGFFNAYDDRFFREMPYISDSCRAWRNSGWDALSRPLPPRFQLALHPVNWSHVDRDRHTVFHSVHHDLIGTIEAEGRALLSLIERHPAVLEHDARVGQTPESTPEALA